MSEAHLSRTRLVMSTNEEVYEGCLPGCSRPAAVPATATPTLRPPAALDRRVRPRGSRTGLRRCSRRGPASPPTRGMRSGLSSVRPTTGGKARRMQQAAEMMPATRATTSATARPAGPPQGERVRKRPWMFRAVEAQTRSCATAAFSSDNDDPSNPHRTQGLRRHRSQSSRRPRRRSRPEETSLDAWFEAQAWLGLVTLSYSKLIVSINSCS